MNFSNESRLGQILEKVLDLCKMNLLWLLGCLPIVTAGASITALFYTANCYRQGEGSVAKNFWNGFKNNFFQATVIWLLILLAMAGALASAVILMGFPEVIQKFGLGILAAILVLLLIFTSMVFPLLSRNRWKLATLASDSLLFAIAFLPKTLKVLGVELLPIALLLLLPRGLLFIMLLWGILGVAWQAYVICGIWDSTFAMWIHGDNDPKR